MSTATRRGRALSTFRDAGTEETFQAETEYDFKAGAYGNYKAAGLVRAARKPRAPRAPQ